MEKFMLTQTVHCIFWLFKCS